MLDLDDKRLNPLWKFFHERAEELSYGSAYCFATVVDEDDNYEIAALFEDGDGGYYMKSLALPDGRIFTHKDRNEVDDTAAHLNKVFNKRVLTPPLNAALPIAGHN